MPYKKKAPARQKKFIGGALSAIKGRKKPSRRGGLAAQAARVAKRRKAPSAKQRGGIAMSKEARANLMRMQREAFKTGRGSKKLSELTKKHGMLIKRGEAQKLMQSQRGSTKRGPSGGLLGMLGKVNQRRTGGKMPRIMSTVTGSRKAKELARKRKTGGIAMSPAARAAMKKRQMERMRGRSGTRVKPPVGRGRARRPAVMPKRGTTAYNQMMARRRAAARRAAAARKRRGPTSRGRLTAAMKRARMLAARRRGRPTSPRRGRPTTPRTRRIPTRRAPSRRPVTRGRRGLGRAVRTIRKAFR